MGVWGGGCSFVPPESINKDLSAWFWVRIARGLVSPLDTISHCRFLAASFCMHNAFIWSNKSQVPVQKLLHSCTISFDVLILSKALRSFESQNSPTFLPKRSLFLVISGRSQCVGSGFSLKTPWIQSALMCCKLTGRHWVPDFQAVNFKCLRMMSTKQSAMKAHTMGIVKGCYRFVCSLDVDIWPLTTQIPP